MALGCIFTALQSPAATYYVNCAAGSDAADGLSASRAWKSVAAVSSRHFLPSDSILFRRGTTCAGMLWPKGSGTVSAPVALDAWGMGPLPKIQASSGEEAAFRLSDQEFWDVAHLEFSGGNPRGIFIDGTRGVLRHIHIRDVVVHDVTGEPKKKESGLVVISPGARGQRFDDVIVDGVTAYGTSQWAGILVGGANFGTVAENERSTNVTIRNSIVHDVAGDGIVLFEVNHGTIENSIAWRTGMQETQTIGTPDAIWTWMCRDCAVRRSEAFLTDSPGVDGGAFDIDWGNDNNIIEESYGHDTQGYCASIFGSEGVTTNSAVQNNVCSDNGRSPRLAKRQGAIFLSTWNGGKLKGVRISGNTIFWNPPVGTAALVNNANFEGSGRFERNIVESWCPSLIRSNPSLIIEGNVFGHAAPPGNGIASRDPGKFPKSSKWTLWAFVSAASEDHDSRGQIAVLESAFSQFRSVDLDAVVVPSDVPGREQQQNLQYDWHLESIRIIAKEAEEERALKVRRRPTLVLMNPRNHIIWRHDGLTTPSELGLAVRSFLGNPDYSRMDSQQ